MQLSDSIKILVVESGFDDNLDPVNITQWIDLGRCIIVQNTSAQKTTLANGTEYIYTYQIFMRKPVDINLIQRESETIRITKKDGTIDKECNVAGFVTLRNWLKIWV